MVSTERLVLFRSEIFGGLTNEINGILEAGNLLEVLKCELWHSVVSFIFSHIFVLRQKATWQDWRDPQMPSLDSEILPTTGRLFGDHWVSELLYPFQMMGLNKG